MSGHSKFALDGFGTELFAGIPVSNFKASLEWYTRLFGCEPNFFPNDTEAVWQIAEHQSIYIIVNAKHAGHSIQNVMGSDLDALIKQIAERGIEYGKEELPADDTRKVMYYDPDGNELGFISVSA